MTREPHVPILLWVATAVLVHVAGYDGSERVIAYAQEAHSLRNFAAGVRGEVRGRLKPVEIALLESKPPDVLPPEAPPDELTGPSPEGEAKPEPEKQTAKEEHHDQDKPKEEAKKPEKKKPEPEPLKVEEPQPSPELEMQRRIAVMQHVQDENQADNPNAEFLADNNNHVEQQTQAKITSTDQNDPSPTPGSHPAGPTDEPGNGEENRVADSDDHEGEVRKTAQLSIPEEPTEASQASAAAAGAPEVVAKVARAAQKAEPGRAARPAQAALPEMLADPSGTGGTVPEARAARPADPGKVARRAQLPELPVQGRAALMGLGATGKSVNGVQLNLSVDAARLAVGSDRLASERLADSERRRSVHRGSWKTVGIERWRSAIENYVPSVTAGNTTALNTAAAPFASYLNTIHNRIHPIFADRFLSSLDNLPDTHPLNNLAMKTTIEIVLDQEEGRIVKMGVTLASGVTAFDISALESVQRASPFGPPPKQIISPDGNVYLHWEFHREPYYACSTYFAYPKMLKADPKSAPSDVAPPEPPPEERGRPTPDGEQHGANPPRATGYETAQR